MGEVFAGRYELVDHIGDGGMGTVWRVWDHRTRTLVAAKVLRQSDAASLLRFVRESATRVRHEHVVTPLGWAGEDDRVLFTMPVVDGGSVRTLVGDHGPLPPLLVAELLRQLLEALRAVHEAGIVHRDVKPANLLLAATGSARPHLYLTDFGIAVEESGPRLTQTAFVPGTPGYVAPELDGGAAPAPAGDVYAAGVVGLVALTGGRLPGPAHTITPPRPPDVPDPLWSLLMEMVAADPTLRPTVPDALAALDVPSLAWDDGVMGDVEVLGQLEEPPPGRPDDPWRDPAEAPTVLRPSAAPTALRPAAAPTAAPRVTPSPVPVPPPPASAPPGDGGPARRPAGPVVLLVGSLLAIVLGGGVLAWTQLRDPEPAPTRSTSQGTAPPKTTPTAPTTPSTTTSATSPSDTRTTGRLNTNVVVTRVDQPCASYQDGQQAVTVQGQVPVTCRYDADEQNYFWRVD